MADVLIPWREVCRAVSNLADNHGIGLATVVSGSGLARDLALVKTCSILLRGEERYPELLSEISKHHRPATLKPGTIGAFLWGCSQSYYGDVERACSPLCPGQTTNSPLVWGTGGYISPPVEEPACHHHVVIVDDGKIVFHQRSQSKTAYIYGGGLEPREEKILRDTGAENLVYLVDDGGSYRFMEGTPAPRVEDSTPVQDTSRIRGILVAVVVLVLVVFALMFLLS